MNGDKVVLAVVELGGYPNFSTLYQSLGYEVVTVQAGRKALTAVRQLQPQAIVAEFNLQRDFRDRTSTLESLLATVQQRPSIKVVVFYDPQYAQQLEQLRARFPHFTALAFPIDPAALAAAL
jgi:CheY-like chemotaxis protein